MTPVTKALIHAIETEDVEAFASLYAEDSVMYEPLLPEPARGRDEIAISEAGLFDAFGDISIELLDEFVSDDKVAIRVLMKATNDGTLDLGDGEMVPTGRRIEVPMMWVLRLDEGGRIVEERDYFDTGTIFRQLGLEE